MADVEFSREGRVARVHLNRPKSLNAITGEMNRLLMAAWNEINADPDIWVAEIEPGQGAIGDFISISEG